MTAPAPAPAAAPAREVIRHVAIAGNPNCGKSTIFNALTGLRQKVGNYPGVTVEKKTGRFFGSHGEPMELLDLPGSYSLQVRSPDEAVARDVLLGRLPGTPRPGCHHLRGRCLESRAQSLPRGADARAADPGRRRAEHGRCRGEKRHRSSTSWRCAKSSACR